MDKRKLNAVMQLHGESQKDLADYLQMSLSRLNAKINEYRGAQFRQNEIAAIREHYGLSAKDVNEFFLRRWYPKKIQKRGDEMDYNEMGYQARQETTIRLPTMLRQQLGKQADRLGVTLHDLILFILWEAVTHTPQE